MNSKALISGQPMPEALVQLADEVAELRGVLQDLSQQARRIERRIDLVLPERQRANKRKAVGGGARMAKASTMGETQARETIKRMTDHLCDGKPIEDIQSELRNMTLKDGLTPIAREFGMTNTALPPKTELVLNIITRLRQSVMLTENIRKMPRVAEDKKYYGDRDKC